MKRLFISLLSMLLLIFNFSYCSDNQNSSKIDTSFLVSIKIGLASLGYYQKDISLSYPDAELSRAIKTYESKRKLPITGNYMSTTTLDSLSKDLNLISYIPLTLPKLTISFMFWNSGFVKAEGTWTFENDDIANPERTSCIKCYKDQGICIDAQAHVQRMISDLLLSDMDLYEIDHWDDHEIVTKPLDFGCQRYTLRLNRTANSVTALRSPISGQEGCEGSGRQEKYMVLSDGFKIYWKLHLNRTSKWLKAFNLNPNVIKYLTPEDIKDK